MLCDGEGEWQQGQRAAQAGNHLSVGLTSMCSCVPCTSPGALGLAAIQNTTGGLDTLGWKVPPNSTVALTAGEWRQSIRVYRELIGTHAYHSA